jgi:hypothetical protein
MVGVAGRLVSPVMAVRLGRRPRAGIDIIAAGDCRVTEKQDLRATDAFWSKGTDLVRRRVLIGLGIEGEEGMEAGAIAGGEEAAAEGINVFGGAEEWDVLEDIPNDSAAALILLEHHWAVPLRDAIARAGGFRLGDGFISPLDLIEIGLMSAEEARALHDMETAAAAKS